MGLAGKPVGMFLGSLYAKKGLDFALEAALAIRRRLPDFNWLVMGDGPDRSKVEAMVNEHPWVHWVGARLGREKVLYAGLCDVLMIRAHSVWWLWIRSPSVSRSWPCATTSTDRRLNISKMVPIA